MGVWKKLLYLTGMSLPVGGYIGYEVVRAGARQVAPDAPDGPPPAPPADPPGRTPLSPAQAARVARAAVGFEPLKTPDPGDPLPPAAAEAARLAADRAHELNNLRAYRSDAKNPVYTGPRAGDVWKGLDDARNNIETFVAEFAELRTAPPPADLPAARVHWGKIEAVADRLKKLDLGSDERAAAARYTAKLTLIGQLGELADGKYAEAVRPAPPIKPAPEVAAAYRQAGDWAGQVVRQVEGDGRAADPARQRVAAAVRLRVAAVAKLRAGWEARVSSLGLFENDPAATRPDRIPELFDALAGLYGHQPDEAGKALVREKAQQVCDRLVPPKLRLGPTVKLDNREVGREKVHLVPNDSDRERPAVRLTDNPDGVNEFNYTTLVPDLVRIRVDGNVYLVGALRPTADGELVGDYHKAREAVAAGEWTKAAVDRLLAALRKDDAANAQRALNDRPAYAPTRPKGDGPARVIDRLQAVGRAMDLHPDLFRDPTRAP